MPDPAAPSSPAAPPPSAAPSPVEEVKLSSRHLRGTIESRLSENENHFDKDDANLLKFHGTYQQDDRDVRAESRGQEQGKAYMFMVRTKIPGGKLTSEQLLAEIDLCEELGNDTLRITSRQGLQLHGVPKDDLRSTIQRINAVQLSTLGACGDVNRNVMCCPAPLNTPAYAAIQEMADRIADHLAPKTPAYHEIWIREEGAEEKIPVDNGQPDQVVEPIYGRTYLPRKFKIGIALPHDNCIDIYTHDLGLLGITDGDRVVAYNVLVGGGMGVTPSAKKTFPALAKKLCLARPEEVIEIVTAVVKVQRDFGNRSDRKVARLKYLIADWGIDRFRTKVEEYLGRTVELPSDVDVIGFEDHMGWGEQGDGRWYYGLNVENGRILDGEKMRLKSAIRAICQELKPSIRLTAHQSILFCDLPEEAKLRLRAILREHHVPLSEEISSARRWSMACVAWPTCGLSITEAERALPGMIDELEQALAELGLEREAFTLRMTGCPNGCARPYNPDIGLVGKAKGKYTIYVGGRMLGTRLAFIHKDMVPEENVVGELVTLFRFFKEARMPGESFGDFCHRQGSERLAVYAAASAT